MNCGRSLESLDFDAALLRAARNGHLKPELCNKRANALSQRNQLSRASCKRELTLLALLLVLALDDALLLIIIVFAVITLGRAIAVRLCKATKQKQIEKEDRFGNLPLPPASAAPNRPSSTTSTNSLRDICNASESSVQQPRLRQPKVV